MVAPGYNLKGLSITPKVKMLKIKADTGVNVNSPQSSHHMCELKPIDLEKKNPAFIQSTVYSFQVFACRGQ